MGENEALGACNLPKVILSVVGLYLGIIPRTFLLLKPMLFLFYSTLFGFRDFSKCKIT